ncbi:MAG: hypothetical protein HFJ60_07950 [Clostridia bacterium]|jgi:hypothetical protein|nr:hypothetical protein [Clostridia bacterium]
MKLEHLIQGYRFNRINAKIQQEIQQEDKAAVININEDINASCLIDDEGIVTAMNLFSNCVVQNNKTMKKQLEHTTQTINVIQKTIELLGNTKQEEANKIMNMLGMFSGKLEAKAVRFTNHVYKIDVANGLLIFSIIEDSDIDY